MLYWLTQLAYYLHCGFGCHNTLFQMRYTVRYIEMCCNCTIHFNFSLESLLTEMKPINLNMYYLGQRMWVWALSSPFPLWILFETNKHIGLIHLDGLLQAHFLVPGLTWQSSCRVQLENAVLCEVHSLETGWNSMVKSDVALPQIEGTYVWMETVTLS